MSEAQPQDRDRRDRDGAPHSEAPAATTPAFAFDPLDPATRRAPFAHYERGRREMPAFVHEGLPTRLVSFFRYADVQQILRDPDTFSNEFQRAPAELEFDEPPPSMLLCDGERHARLRGLVNKAFTPRIVQRLAPRMREVANELVDRAVEQGEVDWIEAFTYPLPVTVIAEIIGVPAADREQFKLWSDRVIASLGQGFFSAPDLEQVKRQRALLEEMRAYFVPLAEQRRLAPQEDLLTGLVMARHEGSQLDHAEMLQMLVLLLVAGNETTTTLIGNATLSLLLDPDLEAQLRAAPERIPAAVEEVLRLASPVQFDPRRVRRSTVVGGCELEEGDVVFCWLGSANRDEAVFEDPDRFRLTRERNPHLAFGFGVHYCIGANLARFEAQIALEALLSRTSRFERVGSAQLPLHPSPVFRAVTQLPLRLHGP